MAELLIKTVTGDYFKYETTATGAGPIMAEVETATSFLCTHIRDGYTALLFPSSISFIAQVTASQFLALVEAGT